MRPLLNPLLSLPCALESIAVLVEGVIQGARDLQISGVAGVEDAGTGDLVFAESPRYLEAALRSRAAAVLVPTALILSDTPPTKPFVVVADPRIAFVRILEALTPPRGAPAGVHPTAVLGNNVRLGEDVHIGPHASIGDETILGDRVTLFAGAHVGEGCVVGDDTTLFPHVVLYPGVRVGRRCRLHSGCVIGADGFGYVPVGQGLRKVPQLGTVELGDDVEIGANSCVDRAKTGVTVVGSGVKIDNLVQVAHNCRIGPSCVLVSQVGVAGSAVLGAGVVMGAQSGVGNHISIGDGARIAARGGAIRDVPAGQTYSGFPARPHTEKMRELAALSGLPDYVKRLRALEKQVEALLSAQREESA